VGASLIKTSLSMSKNCKINDGKFITHNVYYANYFKFPPTTFYNGEIVNVA